MHPGMINPMIVIHWQDWALVRGSGAYDKTGWTEPRATIWDGVLLDIQPGEENIRQNLQFVQDLLG